MGSRRTGQGLTAGMPDEVTIAWMTRLTGIELGQLVLGETAELSASSMSNRGTHVDSRQHMFEPVLAKVAGDLDSVTIKLGCEVVDLTSGEAS